MKIKVLKNIHTGAEVSEDDVRENKVSQKQFEQLEKDDSWKVVWEDVD